MPSVLRVKQHCCSCDFGSFQSWFRMNSCNTHTHQTQHKCNQPTSFSNFARRIRNRRNKNQLRLQTLTLPWSLMLLFHSCHDPLHPFLPLLLLHSLICSLSDWLSICVFTVSTNHRLLKTKANPRPEIKSVWESPRCAALIHFSYPRGTSKSPSINREAALS